MLRQGQAALLILFALLLGGCARMTEYYVPPEQRNPYELSGRKALSHFIALNAPNAADHFVADVVPELNDGSWRWVMRRPTFQFRVPTNKGLKLRVDLTVPDITFAQTGPVRVEVMIGGNTLDTLVFEQAGQRTYEKPVPAEWIQPDEPVLVALEIDKMWKSPTDGLERGFIITKIGFVQ